MTDPPDLTLDPIQARAARDDGESAVLERQREEWRQRYVACADRFLAAKVPGDTFLGEDLRAHALRRGAPQPSHPNAWSAMAGTVIRRWLKAGMIAQDGIDHAQSVATHAHRYVRYRVLRERPTP